MEYRKQQLVGNLKREVATALSQRHKTHHFGLGTFVPDVDSKVPGLSPWQGNVRLCQAHPNLGQLDVLLGAKWDIQQIENITTFVTSINFRLTKDNLISVTVNCGQDLGRVDLGRYRSDLSEHIADIGEHMN